MPRLQTWAAGDVADPRVPSPSAWVRHAAWDRVRFPAANVGTPGSADSGLPVDAAPAHRRGPVVTRRMRLIPAIGRSETSFSSSSSSFQKQGGEGGGRFGESEEDAQTGSGGRGGDSGSARTPRLPSTLSRPGRRARSWHLAEGLNGPRCPGLESGVRLMRPAPRRSACCPCDRERVARSPDRASSGRAGARASARRSGEKRAWRLGCRRLPVCTSSSCRCRSHIVSVLSPSLALQHARQRRVLEPVSEPSREAPAPQAGPERRRGASQAALPETAE